MQAFHSTVGYFCNAVVDLHWQKRLLEDLGNLEIQATTCQEEDKPALRARLHAVIDNALAQFKEKCLKKSGAYLGEKIFAEATHPQLPAMQRIENCWRHVQNLLKPDLPSEIWTRIFSFLPAADLTNLLLVTRRFHAIILNQPEPQQAMVLRLKNYVNKKIIPIYALSETLNRDYFGYNVLDFYESYCDNQYHTGRKDLRQIFFKRKCDRTGTEPPLIFKPIPPNPKGVYPPVVVQKDHYYCIWVRVNYSSIQYTPLSAETPDRRFCSDAESTQIKLELEEYILEHYQNHPPHL